jgi:uncharacterized protein YbaP (TraB family)
MADTPSPPPTTDWAANEVVEVVHQAPGPAFWHVKKGESEIWILGTLGTMPEGMNWNTTHTSEIIKGARVVLTAPTASTGILSVGWFLLTHRGLLSMPDGKKLEDTLPPDLKTRFVAARSALTLGLEKFEDDAPVVVAMELQDAYNENHKLVNDGVLTTIKGLAKQHGVPVKTIGDYDALGLFKEMLRLPQRGQQQCLADSVAYTEAATVHGAALNQAWAVGDLKQIKAHFVPRAFAECIKQSASFGKFLDRAVADYLIAIHEALAKPGKVVMLTDIGSLLRSTGVAEALHKEGITVEGPAE